MAGTISPKATSTTPKQFGRNGLMIPFIIIFIIGFFFVSSLKIRVVYSTASTSNSG